MARWDIEVADIPAAKRLSALGEMPPRAERLVQLLGLRPLAALLDTDPGNLRNAITGKREFPKHIAKRMLDIDHVLARALLIFAPEVLRDWLLGSEPFLEFARPIDVLAKEGSPRVLAALNDIEAGAYA